jgi:serine/threonine-protein kinase
MIGETLGHYRILDKLGQGGMGEVYRARDPRLNRDVALKVLPSAFAQDPERMARFEREAQVLASLNHPNIAQLYGLEERALVMEYVPGEVLRGPLPVDEALPLARQIAEALEYAHERGIIHRDLKPANIKVTPEGQAKVLDFGLAKALEGEASGADLAQSPTLSAGPTRAGVILGTAAYMSPEQARGKPLDRRTDIWAFGCVLYELLVGRQTFGQETFSDTNAAILTREPDWSLLPAATPAKVRDLLRRCLQKNARQRLRDIGDARLLIDEALAGEPAPMEGPRPRRGPGLIAAFAAGLLAAGAGAWLAWRTKPPAPAAVKRFVITLPPNEQLPAESVGQAVPAIALSRDGTRLVYAGVRDGAIRLYLRRLDQVEAVPIPGTEGAEGPFFSPDGEWVAFLAQRSLKKVSLAGGTPQTIAEASQGGTWTVDNSILYTARPSAGISRLPAAGGESQPVTQLDVKEKLGSHRWAQVLPGGQALLFAFGVGPFFLTPSIHAQSLNVGTRRRLLEDANFPQYAASGHLVFVRNGLLMAAPFDARKLEVTGAAVPVVEGVRVSPSGSAYLPFRRKAPWRILPDRREARTPRKARWRAWTAAEKPNCCLTPAALWTRASPRTARASLWPFARRMDSTPTSGSTTWRAAPSRA